MLLFPVPESLNGSQLEAELAAAGLVTSVYIDADGALVFHSLEESDRVAAEAVLAAHVPLAADPSPPSAEDRVAVLEAQVAALAKHLEVPAEVLKAPAVDLANQSLRPPGR